MHGRRVPSKSKTAYDITQRMAVLDKTNCLEDRKALEGDEVMQCMQEVTNSKVRKKMHHGTKLGSIGRDVL